MPFDGGGDTIDAMDIEKIRRDEFPVTRNLVYLQHADELDLFFERLEACIRDDDPPPCVNRPS